MDIETFRHHCLAVNGATESLPFLGHNVLVFKVMGKMFCMVPLEPKDGVLRADLKCDPARSMELRERYEGVGLPHVPSADMWNRITLESDVPDSLIEELIRISAEEVLKTLSKKKRQQYEEL